MPTLRAMIDGKTPFPPKPGQPPDDEEQGQDYSTSGGGSPDAKGPSPAARHVADHIQDPFGSTKDVIDELNEAQLKYEMAKAKVARGLTPVHQIVKGIDQQHGLGVMQQNPYMADPMMQNPDEAMAMDDPNSDPNGNGQAIAGDPAQRSLNMAPAPTPGGLPGPAEAVRPPKMGVPSPGAALPKPGFPGTGMPQQKQFSPMAPKPAGAGKLPGAKGPGDPKVQNKIGQAQGKKPASGGGAEAQGKKIKIEVHGTTLPTPSKTPLSAQLGVATLRNCGNDHDEDMDAAKFEERPTYSVGQGRVKVENEEAYGTSEGVKKAWESRERGEKEPGAFGVNRDKFKSKYGYDPGSWDGKDRPEGSEFLRRLADDNEETFKTNDEKMAYIRKLLKRG